MGLIGTYLHAQVLKESLEEPTRFDSVPTRSLRLKVDALGFFRDNEYSSKLQNGYSLPGFRLSPRLVYNPIHALQLEAGVSMLFFNGANKYPNYAYHDIALWKGNQYQHGTHVLPWVRLQASFKHVDLIIGNLYGGSNHHLITPLFNPEQNISADPEMGLQVLLHRPHAELDTWLNWQSYQFESDTHQEVFTVGMHNRLKWQNAPKTLTYFVPLQVLAQHRGGEQDKTSYGVQTFTNASIGTGIRWEPSAPGQELHTTNTVEKPAAFTSLEAQVNALGCYQQAGELWPFETGFAWHAALQTTWWKRLTASIDYVHIPKQFVSLYGNPFYSSLSLKHGSTIVTEEGTLTGKYDHRLQGLHNLRLGLDYQYTFAKAYTVGTEAEIFSLHNKRSALHEFNFSFGVYIRVTPSLLLKRWE